MTDAGNEEERNTQIELSSSVDTIISRSLYAHTLFDQEWNKPSYHNQFHIAATLETVDVAFTSLHTNDPLEITAQMEQWNQQYPDYHISDPLLLRQAFRIAFACHDLGNITADEPISSGGELVLADEYRSVGAEDRSKVICKKFINDTLGDHPQRTLVTTLAEHIIDQTKFGQRQFPENPFWTLVQTIDQIGSAYFSRRQNEELVAGLIQEANGNMKLKLVDMIGFTNTRLDSLFPDQKRCEAVRALFEHNDYGHARKSFEFDSVLGDPNRMVWLDDIPVLLLCAKQKS